MSEDMDDLPTIEEVNARWYAAMDRAGIEPVAMEPETEGRSMTTNRPTWLSAETAALLDMYRDASGLLAARAKNDRRLREIERDLLDAVRRDVMRMMGATG